VLRGAAVFRGLTSADGRCDVGDPRAFGREDWGATREASLALIGERCRLYSGRRRVKGQGARQGEGRVRVR